MNSYKTFLLFCIPFLYCNGEKGSYLGCYSKDNVSISYRPLNDSEICVEWCESKYYRYAAIFDNQCRCINIIEYEVVGMADCDTMCQALNSESHCGGISKNVQSLYDTGINLSGPVSNLHYKNITETSIQITWDPPPAAGIQVIEYDISAIQLKSYAAHNAHIKGWIVQNNTNVFELASLCPATRYNITVTSKSLQGIGGSEHLIAETLIGIPDPEPEEPVILEAGDATMIIEIHEAENMNGPINFYRVVVHFVGDEILQEYDESLLKNYYKSKEDGTPYYIAAELEAFKNSKTFTVGDGKTYRGFYNAPLPKGSHVHISIGVVSTLDNITKVKYATTTHHQHEHENDKIIHFTVEEDPDELMVTILTIACVIFGIILVASIAFYAYLRVRTTGRVIRRDHHEMQGGPILEVENNGFVPDSYEQRNFNEELGHILEHLGIDRKLSRKLLTLDINQIIGTGDYGDVLRGNLRRSDQDLSCQVHVISDDMEKIVQIHFLNELNGIIRLEKHPNLLDFYGVCVTPDWCYLIFEDMMTNLKQTLLNARISPNVKSSKFSTISEEIIFAILRNVCEGMVYLAQNNIPNKKLCARSVFVNTKFEVKISSFGPLLYGENNQMVDVSRWSSPEAIKFQNHSIQSDVWSFGLLVWESCCLGATPFGQVTGENLFQHIKNGFRPEKPTFMETDLYQMCLNCWDIEATERPIFADLSRQFRELTPLIRYIISFENIHGGVVQVPPYLPHLEYKF